MNSQQYKMNNNSQLDQNEKILIDAFKSQNQQEYDQALDKLAIAGNNLITIIEKIQTSPEFYMKYMQLMKEERELISERDYKEFLAKNQKVLSRNFQKNAYLALLMQEMEEKQQQKLPKKMTSKEQAAVKKFAREKNASIEQIHKKFPKISKQDLNELLQNAQQSPSKPESMDIQLS